MSNETAVAFVGHSPVLAAAITLPVLGAGIVAFRFWVRISRKQGLRADDWTILAAVPCVTGMGILLIWGVAKKSIGYTSEPYPIPKPTIQDELLTETTPKQTVTFIVYWVVWLIMIPANGFIKLSALLLYRRMFVVDKASWIDRATKIMLLLSLIWTIGFFFAQVFGCGIDFYKPFKTLDDVASCRTNIRYNALMITDLITDILVWILPVTIIWRLRMPLKKKISAIGVLSLAACSLAAAVIRLIVELDIASGGYANPINLDLTLTLNLYYSMIESGLAVIAASLPITCVPLIGLLIPRSAEAAAKRKWETISMPRQRQIRDPYDITVSSYTMSCQDAVEQVSECIDVQSMSKSGPDHFQGTEEHFK